MTDQDLIAATVLGIETLISGYLRDRRRRDHDEADIATVAEWDRSIARLIASIAERHTNTNLEGAANPRGYCPACGGYFGERCADMAGAVAICEAWIACVPVIRPALDDDHAAELALIFPIADGGTAA